MRVYISVDMEGIGGINHPHPTDPKDSRYSTSVALMVGETNAAIEGAVAAGATDILVNDSHWNMYNLLPEDLHEAARVLQGEKAWSMVAGAQPRVADGLPDGLPAFDVALFVGYHARAGHPRGTIAHTYSGKPVETRLDGRPTGEYGLNALILGAWGIPVGMVAGDDALADEVEAWLPWAERVVVKEADGTGSAISVHPRLARDLVRAVFAVSGIFDLRPLMATPYNEDLRLNPVDAMTASPLFWPVPRKLAFDSWVGAAESFEFLRQARSLAAAWTGLGMVSNYVAVPGENHFSVAAGLAHPESAMARRLVELAD